MPKLDALGETYVMPDADEAAAMAGTEFEVYRDRNSGHLLGTVIDIAYNLKLSTLFSALYPKEFRITLDRGAAAKSRVLTEEQVRIHVADKNLKKLVKKIDPNQRIIELFEQAHEDTGIQISISVRKTAVQLKPDGHTAKPNMEVSMKQAASGLRHLHGLGLVHRDIKPQNMLISSSSSSRGRYRMLISVSGVCKKLDVNQSSYLSTAYWYVAAGTAGWRAPECRDGLVSLDSLMTPSDDTTTSSILSLATNNFSSDTSTTIYQCLKNCVDDFFALGCLYDDILTSVYSCGNRDREANIINEIKDFGSNSESAPIQEL